MAKITGKTVAGGTKPRSGGNEHAQKSKKKKTAFPEHPHRSRFWVERPVVGHAACRRYLLHVTSHTSVAAIMSSSTAHNLSVLELLQALNEKLDLEFSRVRKTCVRPVVPAALLQTEVSAPQTIYFQECKNEV